ncbi:MAG: excinuclease ABC subunit UvrB [Bacteroidia bacterium]|nr:excinuclease ABC subunit UvrB [Bacteroidia bacterium]MDW8348353.1 excinuclease ABC subunit UvrB [Bacteroidia bacterium]
MSKKFELISDFEPAGDQPEAIEQLVKSVQSGEPHTVLLGVTGSGKTFTIANMLAHLNRPALVLSHNKTLAAQLYGEFKQFFPNNAVEYFISYYDYYQPESYIPSTNTYIEKQLSINQKIEKFRLRTVNSLISGRKDVVVVSSISCIYGMGNPKDYHNSILHFKKGQIISKTTFLYKLTEILYSRDDINFNPSNFRIRGENVDVFPLYEDNAYRFVFFSDQIEQILEIDPINGTKIKEVDQVIIYPSNIFVTPKHVLDEAIRKIQDELYQQVQYFKRMGMMEEAKRIEDRTTNDMEMMREVGYCSGIENYSVYLSQRERHSRPYCLLDYFPEDYILIIDESHVTIPQVRAMYNGDRQRKLVLVEHGFRLPSALDNRPLKFEEFEAMPNQKVYVSATPGDYELRQSQGILVEQIVRPTGLLDPPVEVRPCIKQVDDLLYEIKNRVQKKERVIVLTLTKRMSEELTEFMANLNIKVKYIHSSVTALERVEILRQLRLGVIDVIVGVNLLREGLDLPEVSLVAILDADKEGFLRSEKALIQSAGRAARNENGKVILYADKITDAMQRLIDETNRRREKQILYNQVHGITPRSIKKDRQSILEQTSAADGVDTSLTKSYYVENEELSVAADPLTPLLSSDEIKNLIQQTREKMLEAADNMNFLLAAKYRDEMIQLEKLLAEKRSKKGVK